MVYPKDHISYSAVSAYLECPMKWYYNYVTAPVQEEEPWVFQVGTMYHSAMEILFKENDFKKAMDMLNVEWDKATGMRKRDVEKIMNCFDTYNTNVFPIYQGRVTQVEYSDRITIPNVDIPFEFRIDFMTMDNTIVDHKTVGTKNGRFKPNIDHSLQMSLYSYCYYVKFGVMPSRVEYHYAYKDTGDIEIATAIPNQNDMLRAIACVQGVYKAIVNDIFYPNFKANCDKCSYKDQCSASLGLI